MIVHRRAAAWARHSAIVHPGSVNRLPLRPCLILALALLSITACSTLPDNSAVPPTYAPTETESSSLALRFQKRKSKHPDLAGFTLLSDPLDAFAARAILTLEAEHSIDAQYYLLNDDQVGRSFLGSLAKAADRGVRVRLLLDDILLSSRRDPGLAAYDAHPNMEIRIINPFSRRATRAQQVLARFGAVTRRMHNKSFIADNQVAVMGGRNIGDEYFEANSEVSFGDLDVFTIGPIVESVSASFDEYWNSDLSYAISSLVRKRPTDMAAQEYRRQIEQYMSNTDDSRYAQAIRDSAFTQAYQNQKLPLLWGDARLIVDSVEKLNPDRERTELHLQGEMAALFADAKSEVIIFSPYLIPGTAGTEGLAELVAKGVKVRILTNSAVSNNHAIVHAHYSKYRKALVHGGVELYDARQQELPANDPGGGGSVPVQPAKPSVLHAKTFVFDRRSVFIGSLNMDPRSWVENTEIGVLFESNTLGADIANWFDENIGQVAYRLRSDDTDSTSNSIVWDSGDGQTTRVEPDTSPWTRFKMKTMSILPIEAQL